jgi:uncharacterized membrane protein YGL010W
MAKIAATSRRKIDMQTQQQFLNEYSVSHRNPINQVIHFVCLPVIFFATCGLLWLIPIGDWLGLPTTLHIGLTA